MREELTPMEELCAGAIAIRMAIRDSRDQRAGARCWLDDKLLYWRVIPGYLRFTAIPPEAEMMRRCARFHEHRQRPGDTLDGPYPPPYNPAWDADLDEMNHAAIEIEIERLIVGVILHNRAGDDDRTWKDDDTLYMLLPERLPANTALPPAEEFLEGLVGCRAFCANCQRTGKVHEW